MKFLQDTKCKIREGFILNIAFITNGLPLPNVKSGGAETLVQYIIDENEIHKKFNITVYSIYDSEAKQKSEKYKFTTFIYLDSYEPTRLEKIRNYLKWKIFRIPSLPKHFNCKQLRKSILEHKFSKIIFENNHSIISEVAKYCSADIYWHTHNQVIFDNTSNAYRIYIKNICEKCKKIITVSEFMKNQLFIGVNIDVNKIQVLKNCTDLTQSKKKCIKNDIRKIYGLKEENIVITFIGRIVPEKGVLELIESFNILSLKYSNIRLLIVGDLSSNTQYIEKIKSMSRKNKNIILTDYIPVTELYKIRSITQIAVTPSKWIEPAGLVIIEAFAMGIPVIATDSGGIPEYIDSSCSLLIKNDKFLVSQLIESLELLICNQTMLKNMSINATKYSQKYNTKNYYDKFYELITNNDR